MIKSFIIDTSFVKEFNFTIDERLYNNIELSDKDLDSITDNMSRDEWKFIKSKFQEFKKSKVEYGNYEECPHGIAPDTGNVGSIPLKVKDFFNYLKITIREDKIDGILAN